MAHFNEKSWRRVAESTQFPIKNVSGSVLAVETLSGSAITVEVASGSYLSTTVSSSADAPIYMTLPADFQLSMIHTIGLIFEEQKKTNLYLEEIIGDKFE